MDRRETNKDRLNKFYNRITMNVVYHYFESCVLQNDLCSLHVFLTNHVSELFHLYNPGISCCKCKQLGCVTGANKKRKLEKYEFERLFKQNDEISPEHEVEDCTNSKTYCICPYMANTSTEICDLDITFLHKIISNCFTFPPTPGSPQWILDVKDIRNKICHSGDSVPQALFVQYLDTLEKATYNLASVVSKMYLRDVQQRFEDLKSGYNWKEDIVDVMQMCNADLENNISKALHEMECKIDGKLQFRLEIPEFNPPDRAAGEISEMREMFQDGREEEKKCFVVWSFKTQGNWNVEEVAKKLKQVSELLDFKIIFVYAGSLIVNTSTNLSLLTNAEDFCQAVVAFLEQFAVKCNLDTSVEQKFDVSFEIYYLPMRERNDYIKKNCKVCSEKDEILKKKEEEINRLKGDMKMQLKQSYSSLMVDVERISRSFSKEFIIEQSFDQFLATYDDENLWKEIKSSDVESGLLSRNEEGYKLQGKDSDNVSEVKDTEAHKPETEGSGNDKSLRAENIASTDDKTVSTTDDLNKYPTEENKKLSTFIVLENLSLGFKVPIGEKLTINSLVITKDDQLIVTYGESNRVFLFSDIGDFLDGCSLSGIAWDACAWPPTSVFGGSPSDGRQCVEAAPVDVIITLPEEECYQHVHVVNNALIPKPKVFVGMYCPGVAVHKDMILIGGLYVLRVYNRTSS